ncbi:hypothetical protein EDB89DRAFT_1906728 [Lactarius sanguifluus]|nr:hypothetical protein EDB89DRAFT_1906728 [Lactarius sanguifluus]
MGTELLLSADAPSVLPLSLPSDSSSGATSHTRNTAQGHCEKQQNGSTQGRRHQTTVGMFPDNVLLEIFDFYRKNHDYTRSPVWEWHLLVHVCKAWRQVVFSSPRQLDIKILCTYGTPVRENLGIWPAFPIIIRYATPVRPNDEDNIVYALEHRDRVCDVELAPGIQWNSRSEKFDVAVQQPFPVLTRLYIDSVSKDPPVLPANFLGGSAPRLQEITLSGIPYPALPVLLLSASDLVKLDLRNIPLTGYISPEAMVTSLATLPRLDHLTIGFQSATPLPDRIRPPPATRIVLPALTSFEFWGTSEYLEDFISHVDSPQLNHITIEYLRLVDYQITELSKFIDRSVGPKLTLSMHAHVNFFSCHAFFSVYPHRNQILYLNVQQA